MGVHDGSLGAFLLGTLFSTLLLGVTATQAFNYYKLFPTDRRLYFWIVTFLLVLDWSHSAVSCYTIYMWMVTHYGEPTFLANSPWSLAVDPFMTGLAASTVQVFYAYRVYVVRNRKPLFPVIIVVLSFLQFVFATVTTGEVFYIVSFSRFPSITWCVSIWLGCAALCDFIITGSLVHGLVKSRSGILQTNNVIDKIIELVIQSNGATAVCAIVDAIFFGADSMTSYHITLNLCLVKLYFNSLLVSLNARADLERHLAGPRSFDFSQGTPSLMTASGFNALDLAAGTKSQQPPRSYQNGHGAGAGGALEIHVNTLKTTMHTCPILAKQDESDAEKAYRSRPSTADTARRARSNTLTGGGGLGLVGAVPVSPQRTLVEEKEGLGYGGEKRKSSCEESGEGAV